VKLIRELHQEGSGKVPTDFKAEKVWIVVLGLVSLLGCPGPNGSEGVKTICHQPYLLDIT
jgi:hypothetical protein